MSHKEAVGIFTSIMFLVLVLMTLMEVKLSTPTPYQPSYTVVTPHTYSPPNYVMPYQR